MDVLAIVYSVLLAIVGTAAIIFIPNIPYYFIKRRRFRKFALLPCGTCQAPFGLEVVHSGEDVSPFEELWSDGKGGRVHHHPSCLSVVCSHCQQNWVLRHNSQGEWFGPEFSVVNPKTWHDSYVWFR